MTDDVLGQGARVVAEQHGVGDHRQGAPGIVLDEGFDELVERCRFGRFATTGGDEFERRDRVAR